MNWMKLLTMFSEIIQNSNFGQEIHESFMDLAVGTGVSSVEEGDAINPVRFRLSLYQMCIWTLALMIRLITFIENAASRSVILQLRIQRIVGEKTIREMQSEPDKKVKVLEVVCRNYSDLNEEKYDYYVINCDDREMIYYELFEGSGSNPYVCFRF